MSQATFKRICRRQLIEGVGQWRAGLEHLLALELTEQQDTLRARLADLEAKLEMLRKALDDQLEEDNEVAVERGAGVLVSGGDRADP